MSAVDGSRPVNKRAEVLLGEDWIGPDATAETALRASRERRGIIKINRSPLARKIITFNLLAIVVLVAGVLFLNPFRDSLLLQREQGLVVEAQLIARIIEGQLAPAPAEGEAPPPVGEAAPGIAETIASLDLPGGVDVFVFDTDGGLLAESRGSGRAVSAAVSRFDQGENVTFITDFLNDAWDRFSMVFARLPETAVPGSPEDTARALVERALGGRTSVNMGFDAQGSTIFTAAAPIRVGEMPVAVVAVNSAAGEIDALVRNEREQVLQMFLIAIFVSIGLSLVLASTIANPLSDLAAAAEIGRERNAGKMNPGRVRIPDLTARPDEIGRLSGALRGMVAALYDRIDANEQFAADVAHEIKNPLASLRSATGTLRMAQRSEQRDRLLDVIEHDVRRLDRLVSDISNASRLDSELVHEDEETFDLLTMIGNLGDHLGQEARSKGIEFISDLPGTEIQTVGLESRLAQVFVNLITNAISFCEAGDAIRVWVRKRENRVLVVVEDTGPGIPEQALTKIFNRFYSERPAGQFGNNSGLGLAISKQIVEAHGGVIWAENIRPTEDDLTSDPLGARFVVGLPV